MLWPCIVPSCRVIDTDDADTQMYSLGLGRRPISSLRCVLDRPVVTAIDNQLRVENGMREGPTSPPACGTLRPESLADTSLSFIVTT